MAATNRKCTITREDILTEGFTNCFMDWAYMGYVKDLTYIGLCDYQETEVIGYLYAEKLDDEEHPFAYLEPLKRVQLYTVEDLKKFLADG